MRTSVSLVVATLLCAADQPLNAAQTEEAIVARAETTFRSGVESGPRILIARRHFSEATDAYRELHERNVRSPALYRNLGNAAVLADRWPEAIWAYQCGLRLDPNDRQMREHLAFARGKVLYPSGGQGRPEQETWPSWLHQPSVSDYLHLIIGCYLLFWLAATGAWLRGSIRLALGAILLIAVAFGTSVIMDRQIKRADFDREMPLVVLAVNTEFYRGNADNYPKHESTPQLPRGLEARQLHRRGAWLQIRLSTGETGWVPAASVLIVQP